jgi:hypothetical protein
MMNKRETIQEFLARGGKVTIVPAAKPEEEVPHTIKPVTTGLPKIMTLEDGGLFFGETRKKEKKPHSKEDSIRRIEKSKLPPEIIASLKKSIGATDDE